MPTNQATSKATLFASHHTNKRIAWTCLQSRRPTSHSNAEHNLTMTSVDSHTHQNGKAHTHTHTLPNKKDAGRGKRATFNIIQHNFGRNERRHDSGPKPPWWHTSSRKRKIPTNFTKSCCLFSSCAWTRIAWTSSQLCAARNKKCKHTSIPPDHLDGNPHIQTSNTKKTRDTACTRLHKQRRLWWSARSWSRLWIEANLVAHDLTIQG